MQKSNNIHFFFQRQPTLDTNKENFHVSHKTQFFAVNPDYPHDWTSHHDITMKRCEVSKHEGYTTNQQLILSMMMNINLD